MMELDDSCSVYSGYAGKTSCRNMAAVAAMYSGSNVNGSSSFELVVDVLDEDDDACGDILMGSRCDCDETTELIVVVDVPLRGARDAGELSRLVVCLLYTFGGLDV